MTDDTIPQSLRTWFLIHFGADMVFGIPLMLFPVQALALIDLTNVETTTARLVGAALMGIGIESYLGRNASREVFQAMLNLKLIWSGCAIFGLLLSLLGGAPWTLRCILGVFALFFTVWVYFKRRLRD